jgi:hypothetical protein
MANADTLGVTEYWDTFDYLALKADQKRAKQANRDSQDPHTPISKYVNPETAFCIRQFKSPRAQHDDARGRASTAGAML